MRPSIYLRVSVTEACNFQCRYCRPERGRETPASPTLTDGELLGLLEQLRRVAVLRKIRFTGGEPLLRPGLPELVQRTSKLFPSAKLGLTTNGSRLAHAAAPLRAAGLHRVNVSLDTLDPGRFSAATGGSLQAVLEGLRATRDAGFEQIKLNAVLLRTLNGDCLAELARFARAQGSEMRFIELMPYGAGAALFDREHLPAVEALDRLRETLTLVRHLGRQGSADRYLFRDHHGPLTVGLIAPVSRPFCTTCDRVRLDCRGRLYGCMRLDAGVDLTAPLRRGDPAGVAALARNVLALKAPVTDGWPARDMLAIGG